MNTGKDQVPSELLGVPPAVSGDTRVVVIVGDPIAQVASPRLFNTLFRATGAKAVFVPLHVPAAGLGALVDGLRGAHNLAGIVVTVPHKIEAASLADELRGSGLKTGAVSALRRTAEGRMIGDNFDGRGCVNGLRAHGHELAGRRTLVVGAGGAGISVAHAIADEGPACIRIHDVDAARVERVVSGIRRYHPKGDVAEGDADPRGFDVVVNCTPLGMKPDDPYPLDPDRLEPGTLVVDVILKPEISPLLDAAAARGCPIQPGIRMLEAQVEAVWAFLRQP